MLSCVFVVVFFSSQPEIPMLRNNSLHCRHSRSRVKVAACLSLALDILCVWLPHSASPPYHIIYVKKKRKKDSFSSALGMCFIKLNTYKKLYLERQISKEKPPTSESGIAAKRIFTEIFLRGADEHWLHFPVLIWDNFNPALFGNFSQVISNLNKNKGKATIDLLLQELTYLHFKLKNQTKQKIRETFCHICCWFSICLLCINYFNLNYILQC